MKQFSWGAIFRGAFFRGHFSGHRAEYVLLFSGLHDVETERSMSCKELFPTCTV